jgi:hypothetical protein
MLRHLIVVVPGIAGSVLADDDGNGLVNGLGPGTPVVDVAVDGRPRKRASDPGRPSPRAGNCWVA